MKKAAISLLSNESLLNPFVLILLKKTNGYEQMAIVRTFDMINLLFVGLTKRSRALPTTFDLNLLLKAIKTILEGDSALATGTIVLM